MRSAIGAFGLLAGAVVVALAARYGYATSDNPVDGGIVAFFFAVIAIGGIAGPAVAVKVFRGARGFGKLWGLLWGVLAVAAVLANLSNSLGAIAGRSDKTLAIRAQAADARRNDQAELEQLMRERAALPPFTATDAAAVRAAERAANAARDARAAECKDRGKHCREREADELTRNTELAAATTAKSATDRAAKLDEQISAARARLEKVPAVSAVNPQAAALEHIFKMPADLAATWQQVAMVVVVELLIAMSLIAWEITAHPHEHASKNAMSALAPETRARPEPRKPIADWVQSAAPSNVVPIAKSERLQTARALSVIDFGAAQLEAAPGDTLDFDEFFNAYVTAAQASKMRAHAVEEFVEPFKKLCAEAGIRTRKRGSKLFLCDVKLAS
jgi:hypothetical protein